MKDSLDILRTDYVGSDSITHHGVKGMRWGVRKSKETTGTTKSTSSTDRFTSRKKKVTEGNGKGAHKRGEGMNIMNAAGEFGVGPWDNYHNAINVYGSFDVGQAPVSTQLGQALRSAVLKEIMQSEEYRNLVKLFEEFEKLASERSKTWNQGNSAATAAFEEKASKLIRDINANMTAIDSKYVDKTKLIKKTVDKTYYPSKYLFSFMSPSSVLKFDANSRTVTKGWKVPPTNPKKATGKGYKNTSK